MIVLMTALLVAGTKTTFRWQNIFWIIASAGTFLAFIVLRSVRPARSATTSTRCHARFGGHGDAYHT